MIKKRHARAIWIWNGKRAGRTGGQSMCGSASRHTTDDKWVTCKMCLRKLKNVR